MRTLEQRRALMLAVLARLQIEWPSPEPGDSAVRTWLGSRTGVGIVRMEDNVSDGYAPGVVPGRASSPT